MIKLKKTRAPLHASVAALALLANAGVAQAQDAAGEDVAGDENTIVVTATLRSESLEDVPLSVAAYSQKPLISRASGASTTLRRRLPA